MMKIMRMMMMDIMRMRVEIMRSQAVDDFYDDKRVMMRAMVRHRCSREV